MRRAFFIFKKDNNLMKIDTSTDGHVHTRLCHHASGEMEEYVQVAVERGLKKLVFLEHLEIGINYSESTWLTEDDFKIYFAEGKRLQEKYRDSIAIGLGVEVGYNPKRVNDIISFLDKYTWDRIGVSYHYFEIDEEHFNVVSSKQSNIDAFSRYGADKVMNRYYEYLKEAVAVLPGNMLCHLDAVLRYHPEVKFTNNHFEMIQDIFKTMAAKNMALEVNTSGFRLRDEPYPSLVLLKEAEKHGITLVAGSDSHRPKDVGRYFDRLSEFANL